MHRVHRVHRVPAATGRRRVPWLFILMLSLTIHSLSLSLLDGAGAPCVPRYATGRRRGTRAYAPGPQASEGAYARAQGHPGIRSGRLGLSRCARRGALERRLRGSQTNGGDAAYREDDAGCGTRETWHRA